MIKIGITERGDASLSNQWVTKLNNGTVSHAIIISKGIAYHKFQKVLMDNMDKIILHATITGFGGTSVEKNVPTLTQSLEGLKSLIDMGFDPNRIVLRVDPIVPTEKGIATARSVIDSVCGETDVRRVKFSVMDNYNHVGARGLKLPWKGLNAPEYMVNKLVKNLMHAELIYSLVVESCAEKYSCIPEKWIVGCVSARDFETFGVSAKDERLKGQRPACKCLSCKTELLTDMRRCPFGCLYCYWKD